ncbi:MAG: polyphenol oxidase family protein [Solirubrobacteraceae bacterium]
MSVSFDADAVEIELPGGACALFTTRSSGNLSLAAGRDHEHGLQMRDRLCGELALDWLCASPQVHGDRVLTHTQIAHRGGQPVAASADGHATALHGVGVMVLAADCVPVVLERPGAVATVHAGWRGLAAGVLERGVDALRDLVPAGEVVAVIGPCAGRCCYEVGVEVLRALELPAPADGGEKALLDLRAVARTRLLASGVDRVLDVDLCTICEQRLFSHRREGADAGRQAAVAWLP